MQRLVVAALLLALIPVWHEVDAEVALGAVTASVAALIGFETLRFAEARAEERRHLHEHPPEVGGAPG